MVKSTFNPLNDIPDLTGKVFFITGGTAGLGAGTVKNIAAHNPSHIYFSGRSTNKANSLITEIRRTYPDVDVTFIECDLTSLDSVQMAAKEFLMSSPRLDVLMCNAGIMAVDADTSKDGYEIQFQVNHLAHALLIKLLAPLMLQTAGDVKNDVRIINLSSTAYQQAPNNGIDFETLKSSQPYLGNFIIPGHKWARYAQSKLANLLYPQALAKRYPEILSVAVHPGIIMTDLFNNIPFTTRLPALLANLGSIIPVEEGPYNQLWAATCPRSNLQSGEYYESIGIVGKRTTRQSKDMSLAENLWDWTEKSLEPFS